MTFLKILKEALSDKKYGWYEPKEKIPFPDEKAIKEMMKAQILFERGQVGLTTLPRPVPNYEDAINKLEDAGCF